MSRSNIQILLSNLSVAGGNLSLAGGNDGVYKSVSYLLALCKLGKSSVVLPLASLVVESVDGQEAPAVISHKVDCIQYVVHLPQQPP